MQRAGRAAVVYLGVFFINTIKLVMPVVLFTLLSSIVVAYGFARFEFPLKNTLFMLMLAMLMLPNAVIIIPRYILFYLCGLTATARSISRQYSQPTHFSFSCWCNSSGVFRGN